jgi:hypothetical protein
VFVVSAAVFCVPLVASVPVQPPEAVQDVALVELQVSTELPPLAIADGAALKLTVGTTGVDETVTVAVTGSLVPPAPVQTSE